MLSGLIIFLFLDLIISFCLATFVYKNSKIFYSPCNKKDANGKDIDLHKEYEPFCPKDELNFKNLWIGGFIFFPIKFLLSLFIALSMKFHLQFLLLIYKNTDSDPKQWKKMKWAISFWSTFFLHANGIKIFHKKVDCKEIYKKYLGEDYDFEDKKYSLLISNHIGFFEVVAFMSLFSAGFMAKKDVANYYFVGPIATAMHCLYVDRLNEDSRKKIFDQLEERQKAFYEGKFLAPLAMFPEGTTTCGRNILKFKRGSFAALLPVKPLIYNVYQESHYHMSIGVMPVVLSYIKNFCHGINPLYSIDMPIIRPTEYMFQNYSNLGSEKWEVYAEVVKKIMAEVGNLKESPLRLRDSHRYLRALKGFYDPNENMNYEEDKPKRE